LRGFLSGGKPLPWYLLLSVAAALATFALKLGAYAVTGSVGLLSDAAETGVNVLAAGTAFFSLWYSAQPVDVNHAYGHEKIEFFSSGMEGVLILLAAVGIGVYAVRRLLTPEPLMALDLGVGLAGAAGLVNLVVGRLLVRVGRNAQSVVVESHGRHLMTDVWTTASVLAGLTLVRVTGIQALDPVMGLLVGAFIVWTGFDLVRRSFHGLMDHALPAQEQDALRSAIVSQLDPGMDFHALRTRRAGSHRFSDCHLLVPGSLSVQAAHVVASRIEHAVQEALPGMEMTVHIEPIEEQAAWTDSALLPLERATRKTDRPKS
jgi:cation diffusion facilitator family transporter